MMPRHIPNRVPAVMPPEAKPRFDRHEHRPPVARRRLWFYGLPLLISLVLATLVHVGGEFRQQRAQRDARLQQLVQANTNMTAELATALDRVATLRADYRRTQTALGAAQRQLTSVRSELQTSQDNLVVQQMGLHQLRQAHFHTLTALGDVVAADVRLARNMFGDAIAFAEAHQLDGAEALRRHDQLPAPSPMAAGTKLTILAVTITGAERTVDIAVRDGQGQFLSGLHRGDFEFYDAAHRLHALSVAEQFVKTDPQDIAVVLDVSASTAVAHVALKQAAGQLIEALANPNRLRVISFGDTVDLLSPWSIDAALHQQAIAQLTPKGGTALHQAIRTTVAELVGRPGPRSIVLFADGHESFDREPLDPTLAECRTHGIPIHVVALTGPDVKEETLRQLASATGGLYLPVDDPSGLARRFREVSQALQRPIYRVRLHEAFDPQTLTVQLGTLAPEPVCEGGIAASAASPHVLTP